MQLNSEEFKLECKRCGSEAILKFDYGRIEIYCKNCTNYYEDEDICYGCTLICEDCDS